MAKIPIVEILQLSDLNTTRKVWVNVNNITAVTANIGNTYEVHMTGGSSVAIDQANFDILKNASFGTP